MGYAVSDRAYSSARTFAPLTTGGSGVVSQAVTRPLIVVFDDVNVIMMK